MACHFYFAQLFVLFSGLPIIFFLCAFLAKMATYSLVIDNVYLVLENHDRQWISCLFLKTSDFQMESL